MSINASFYSMQLNSDESVAFGGSQTFVALKKVDRCKAETAGAVKIG